MGAVEQLDAIDPLTVLGRTLRSIGHEAPNPQCLKGVQPREGIETLLKPRTIEITPAELAGTGERALAQEKV
jgi:hypothetical protein